MVICLYQSAFERYFEREGLEDAYFNDWTYLLPGTPMEEEYDSDQAGHYEMIAEEEGAARIRRTAILSSEHVRFMVWLAGEKKMELYEEFKEDLRAEQTNGEYPGVPVRDLKK